MHPQNIRNAIIEPARRNLFTFVRRYGQRMFLPALGLHIHDLIESQKTFVGKYKGFRKQAPALRDLTKGVVIDAQKADRSCSLTGRGLHHGTFRAQA